MSHSELSARIRSCRLCEAHLPEGPNPIFRIHLQARIALISQAPGRAAHRSGVAYQDPSGRRLRQWLGVSDDIFYNTNHFAIVPMGFCYPGKAPTGDRPPRPECAPQWHEPVLQMMPALELFLYIGQYAQRYYLGGSRKKTLTETVRHWRQYGPDRLPLPHPSPLNNGWLRRHPWFEQKVIPDLQQKVQQIIRTGK